MNNQGQVAFFTLMIGIVIIILALAFAPGIKTQIDSARNTTSLDCANSTTSDFNKAACVVSDFTIFYFISSISFTLPSILPFSIAPTSFTN